MYSKITICSKTPEEGYNELFNRAHKGVYTSYLRGKRCVTEVAFFHEISASFQFPCYFGENWAALDECLCDLDWLQFSSIFILIDDFSQMFSGDKELQSLLIKYLSNIVDYWKAQKIPVNVWLNN